MLINFKGIIFTEDKKFLEVNYRLSGNTQKFIKYGFLKDEKQKIDWNEENFRFCFLHYEIGIK